jgi:hypothetical protein
MPGRVLVLRVNGRAAHDDKPSRGYRNRAFAFAFSWLIPFGAGFILAI